MMKGSKKDIAYLKKLLSYHGFDDSKFNSTKEVEEFLKSKNILNLNKNKGKVIWRG